jgi:branched-chain amino acid aminotransferase
LSVDEIFAGAESGRITEAFGAGTAVVVSPVGQFTYRDRTVMLGDGKTTGEVTQKLYDTLTGIQCGQLPDPHGWVDLL